MYACRPLDARALWRMLRVVSVLAICTPVSTNAQFHDGPGKYGALTGDTLFSNDSDQFNEARANLGYLFPNGWGLGASVTHYDAPDWSADGRGLYGQYRQHDAQQTVDARLGVMDTGVDNVKQDGRFTDNHLGRSTGLIVGGYSAMFVAPCF